MSSGEIRAENLIKRYGEFTAVDGVSFSVKSGEIFGFLGPNGAGKSTTVKMLTTLALPTAGRGLVGGYDVMTQAGDVRRIAGVALQEIGLDNLMKSTELLTIQGQLFGMTRRQAQDRAAELLALVKLTEFTDRPVGKYSGGMRRRLDLAMALVHQPEILFLDEPTTGLDPASRRDIWAEVRRLNRDFGMTIFLTTQYLEEADELADRIAIIDRAQIRVEGQPAELKAALGSESINVTFREDLDVQRAQDQVVEMFDRVQIDRKTIRLYRNKAAEIIPAVVNRLSGAGLEPVALTLTTPTLDDVFLQVTGARFEEDAKDEAPKAGGRPGRRGFGQRKSA
ncbi:MAG: ATP-binding cassette domain-containing protein [Anaerolineae bacterium]|nr:ATP-binding cassette domain-containing protein [Anaerolineae bacterium]NUQ06829.1 ATP-binding cassette domain-containing protein [Anaerolineae bacterium]